MRSTLLRTILTFITLGALVVPPLSFAQDQPPPHQQTRPRRVSDRDAVSEQARPQVSIPTSTLTTNSETRRRSEPMMRIGLATDARAASISTTSQLVTTSEDGASSQTLGVARVRIEPRVLSPYPSTSAPSESIDEARSDPPRRTRDPAPEDSTSESITQASTAPTNTAPANVTQASSTRATRVISEPARTAPAPRASKESNVRLAARPAPALLMRAAMVYGGGTVPLLQARVPLTFSSTDEQLHSVKFNDKPYRGRLEVFANERGTLTIVNVVGLEDYVRGVVPNELSPGGHPELEALKAQAIAARTYAVNRRGQFTAQGFDILPTTRSQVYGGRQTEHPLSDRAVLETAGLVATFEGEPINALYTSTCGGRTEHAENIFGGEAVPYLRGRECAYEGRDAFAPFTVRTSREHAHLRDPAHATSARDAALLAVHNFKLPARLTDEWLAAPIGDDEVRAWLIDVASLSHQRAPVISADVTRPPGFSTALALATYGESRGDVLLNTTDVDYTLAFRDANEIPAAHRADVALLVRDGHLALYQDATLRPRVAMSRGHVLRTLARLLEARGSFRLQKALARPAVSGALTLRDKKASGERRFSLNATAFLFRAFGEILYAAREVTLVGGEPVT
ncbi:MAG: SpoIID/LytB domain-containing protein, partial [Pyrinomonadaceae bacterium]|nr:SpoIID/LytB domain-containing protein [Pyrinomonadaceae bacterium]